MRQYVYIPLFVAFTITTSYLPLMFHEFVRDMITHRELKAAINTSGALTGFTLLFIISLVVLLIFYKREIVKIFELLIYDGIFNLKNEQIDPVDIPFSIDLIYVWVLLSSLLFYNFSYFNDLAAHNSLFSILLIVVFIGPAGLLILVVTISMMITKYIEFAMIDLVVYSGGLLLVIIDLIENSNSYVSLSFILLDFMIILVFIAICIIFGREFMIKLLLKTEDEGNIDKLLKIIGLYSTIYILVYIILRSILIILYIPTVVIFLLFGIVLSHHMIHLILCSIAILVFWVSRRVVRHDIDMEILSPTVGEKIMFP